MTARQRDAITGVLGAGLSFVGSFLIFSALPKVDAPAAEYVSFVDERRGRILLALVALSVAVGLLVWWAAALRQRLLAMGGAGDHLPDLVLAGAVLALGSGFAGFTPLAAVAWRGPEGLDANVVRLLVDMLPVLFTVFSAVPFFVFVLPAALAMRRTRLVPAWIAWLGVAAAVANGAFVFALFSRGGAFSPYSPLGLVAAVLLFAWIIASSVVMMIDPTANPLSELQPSV